MLQNGAPLQLDKFEWDEEKKEFKTGESDLVIDFNDVNGCGFETGSDCVAVRRDTFEVIQPSNKIKTHPCDTPGYLEELDGRWYPYGDM